MRTFSCQSGSNGNCIFVQAGGTRLLVDAGISGQQAALRLETRGEPIRAVDALLVTHEHGDHARCAGIYQRKYGLPIYATHRTAHACRRVWQRVHDVRTFTAGETLQVGGVQVETIPTAHDAVDGVCYVVQHGQLRLGVLTDLGCTFSGLAELLATLDGVFLESNYDPGMLASGPYPYYLKRRISGDRGHLANGEAGALLRDHASEERLRWAVLSHLSEVNNTPELALQTAQQLVDRPLPIHVASRYEVSPVYEL